MEFDLDLMVDGVSLILISGFIAILLFGSIPTVCRLIEAFTNKEGGDDETENLPANVLQFPKGAERGIDASKN